MAEFINDAALDAALSHIRTECTHLYICSSQPATWLAASSTAALGVKAAPTIGAPTNGDVSGRKVVISAITDGTVTVAGNATHFALTDNTGEVLLAAQALDALVAVTTPGTFTLTECDITLPDPA